MYEKTFTFTNTVTIYEPGDIVKVVDSHKLPHGAVYTVVECEPPDDNRHGAIVFLQDENGNTKNELGHRIYDWDHFLELVEDVKENGEQG